MNIKGPGEKPFVPQINPKDVKPEKAPEEKLVQKPAIPLPSRPGIGRGPEIDSHAIATRLAVLATEAKEKELKFEDIIDRVIAETGMTNAQGAMEEANRRVQKEIEEEIVKIKDNKDLMEEAEAWQNFAEVLSRMNEEQVEGFISLIRQTIGSFA